MRMLHSPTAGHDDYVVSLRVENKYGSCKVEYVKVSTDAASIESHAKVRFWELFEQEGCKLVEVIASQPLAESIFAGC